MCYFAAPRPIAPSGVHYDYFKEVSSGRPRSIPPFSPRLRATRWRQRRGKKMRASASGPRPWEPLWPAGSSRIRCLYLQLHGCRRLHEVHCRCGRSDTLESKGGTSPKSNGVLDLRRWERLHGKFYGTGHTWVSIPRPGWLVLRATARIGIEWTPVSNRLRILRVRDSARKQSRRESLQGARRPGSYRQALGSRADCLASSFSMRGLLCRASKSGVSLIAEAG